MEEQKRAARPDRKGWLNEYETVFVLPNDQTDEIADKTAERMRGVVEREAGRVVKFTFWGRKKTAFDVAKHGRAIYVHMGYLGLGRTVDEVERQLRNSEEVVRFQTSLVKKLVDPASRPTEPDVRLSGDLDERPQRSEREQAPGEGEPTAEEMTEEAPPETSAE